MKRRSGAGTIAALALTCVFGATLLMSLAAGAGVYRRVADRIAQGSGQRVGLSYITAKIRAYDEAGAVRVGDFGGEEAVFLLQNVDGIPYETILYTHDGWLMELLCEQGWELEPEDGETITEAQNLKAGLDSASGLLRLEFTDGSGRTQTTHICLKGGG